MGSRGDESIALVNKLPTIRKCCFFLVFTGLICATVVLVRDRKNLTMTAVLLTVTLSLFIVSTITYVAASFLMLHSSACEEDPDLMSQYIWLAIAYLSVQLVLAVAIPVLLMINGKYPSTIVMIWMVVLLLIGLSWTHFISVVNAYRLSWF